jgi:hypothetical protein
VGHPFSAWGTKEKGKNKSQNAVALFQGAQMTEESLSLEK